MSELKRDVVFISHRKTDEEVAQLIRQFLIQAGVKDDEIFCSSIPGNDVNEKIDSEVKGQLKRSAVIILLLSEKYFKSPYCLNEAGIAWYLDDEVSVLPIALDHIEAKDMVGFLDSNYRLRRLTDINDILGIYDMIIEKLALPRKPVASVHNDAGLLMERYSGLVRSSMEHDDNALADREMDNQRDIIKATEIKKKFLQEFEKPLDVIKKIPREKLRNEPYLKYRSYEIVLASKDVKSFSDSETGGYGKYELYDVSSDGLLFWDYFEGEQEKRVRRGDENLPLRVRPLNCLLFEDILSWDMDGNEYYRCPIVIYDHKIDESPFRERFYLAEDYHWVINEDQVIEDAYDHSADNRHA